MKWHIITVSGNKDKFVKNKKIFKNHLVIPFESDKNSESIKSSLPYLFENYSLSPSPIAYDFLRLAVSVYSADIRIPRDGAYDQWTRDMHLFMPVSNVQLWQGLKKDVEEMLAFLTGDHWELYFRELDKSFKRYVVGKSPKKINLDAVSLFSGGLDSYCGAINVLADKRKVAFIGHHSAGGGSTSKSQEKSIRNIWTKHSEIPFFKIWLTTPKGESRSSEITTRGRSIIFIGLGVFIANGFQASELIIPENGLISLNVPLTNSRLGTYSTRTTHPHFISLIKNIIKSIGLDLDIVLPYRFKTKGEVLAECLDKDLLIKGLKDTMSCSHPSAGRYEKIKGNPHCGYCIPCIARRAAITKALKSDPTLYMYPINDSRLTTNKMMDQKTLCMALSRQKINPVSMADILTSGPLPGSDDEKQQYFNMYQRGMQELREFISGYVSI